MWFARGWGAGDVGLGENPEPGGAGGSTRQPEPEAPGIDDPIDSCPPGSAAPGILQARTLEWVAISFSNA